MAIIAAILLAFLGYLTFSAPQSAGLGLEKVFADQPAINNIGRDVVSIAATGDVSFAHAVNSASLNRYSNFSWPFDKVAPLLRLADITVVNLESPIFGECPLVEPKYYILCGDKKFVDGLKFSGVDVVNVANNHIADYGVKKAEQQLNLLRENGLMVSGAAGRNAAKIKNAKVAFLGFNDIDYNDIEATKEEGAEKVIDWAKDPKAVASAIKLAKKANDIVVVSYHWGQEYTEKVTDRQISLAHLAVDSGADLVLGNHPHWIQPVEVYKNKMIVYSHGSLVFDLNSFKLAKKIDERNRIGLVGKYYFSKDKILGVQFTPVRINDDNQPVVLEGESKANVLNYLKDLSLKHRKRLSGQ